MRQKLITVPFLNRWINDAEIIENKVQLILWQITKKYESVILKYRSYLLIAFMVFIIEFSFRINIFSK